MRLREQRKATHARALPDQVVTSIVVLRLPSIPARSERHPGKRGERVARQGTTHAVDDDIHPAASVRRATPSVRLSAERSMTLSKPRARACSALAGLVVVEIAFAAPRARPAG